MIKVNFGGQRYPQLAASKLKKFTDVIEEYEENLERAYLEMEEEEHNEIEVEQIKRKEEQRKKRSKAIEIPSDCDTEENS